MKKVSKENKDFAQADGFATGELDNRKGKTPLKGGALVLRIVIIAAILFAGFRIVSGILARKSKGAVIERVYPVSAETAEARDMTEYFLINGDVKAENSINVLPDATSGKLVRYTVNVGDRVGRNQILGYVDQSRPGMDYANSPFRAPLAGTVISLPIELGNTVTSQTVVAEIGDLSRLKIEAYIPERYYGRIKANEAVKVTLPAYQGQTFEARIVELAPAIDPSSRTALVKMRITQGGDVMKSGMYAELAIATELYKNALSVPASAIVSRGGDSYIFIIGPKEQAIDPPAGQAAATDFDGAAMLTKISRGPEIDSRVVILEGLEAGQQVVVAGQTVLNQGNKIRVISGQNGSAAQEEPQPETAGDASAAPEEQGANE